ncbi:MAG TPA: sigma-70 family RNA polymerase sigma factor [Gemmatimonadales bacterium]|nr:sigma-70 family RNA polymerase sigma factor [Gemmatimonadales bacterium]
MSFPMPDVLQGLLSARDPPALEAAWTAFLESHSNLILQVARSLSGDHDAVMDRYAFVLDSLQRDDFHRLRTFQADGTGRFSTWLIVVVRRLCLDHHRQRYGRTQSDTRASLERKNERRQLENLVGEELGLALLEASADEAPDSALLRGELRNGLHRAVRCLTASDRLVLRLRFEDDRSVPEIARMLGAASPFGMYRRIDRILAELRRALKSGGIEEAGT